MLIAWGWGACEGGVCPPEPDHQLGAEKLQGAKRWALILAPPPSCCVTSVRFLHLSVPLMENEEKDVAHGAVSVRTSLYVKGLLSWSCGNGNHVAVIFGGWGSLLGARRGGTSHREGSRDSVAVGLLSLQDGSPPNVYCRVSAAEGGGGCPLPSGKGGLHEVGRGTGQRSQCFRGVNPRQLSH